MTIPNITNGQPNLTALQLTLNLHPAELKFRYRLHPWDLGPMLQGVLMEQIDSGYADYLHQQSVNPYTQFCTSARDHLLWSVIALNDQAAQELLVPLLRTDFTSMLIKKHQLVLKVNDRALTTIERRELTGILTQDNATAVPKTVTIQVNTPAAFKQAGRYVFHPDIRLLFQNLSMRYSALYEGDREPDIELLDLLSHCITITSYNLKSQYFALGESKIPAFIGRFTLKLSGADTLNKYARMLLQFGEYAGIGIKSSMGMGAMHVEASLLDRK